MSLGRNFSGMFNKSDELVRFLANNRDNPKFINGCVTNKKSLEMFDLVEARLKKIPNDSQEADLLIAGLAIRAMTYQDCLAGTAMYKKNFFEIQKICGKDMPNSRPEEKLELLKKWGHFALIEKTLGFEGKMPIFDRPSFVAKLNDPENSSFVNFTARFDKYNLVEKKIFAPTMMYGEY